MPLRSRTATLVAVTLAVLAAVGILFFTARPARAEEWCKDPATDQQGNVGGTACSLTTTPGNAPLSPVHRKEMARRSSWNPVQPITTGCGKRPRQVPRGGSPTSTPGK
jgi:hypothetical protein